MFTYNLGKTCDLISIYQNHFNENYKDENDSKWLEKGEIRDEFFPFFCAYNGRTLIEELLFNDINKLTESGNIISILENLLNCRLLAEQLVRFYFDDSDFRYLENDFHCLQYVGQLISKSDLTYKLKSCLMAFFMDPTFLTQKLVGNMIYIASQISNLYENQFKKIMDLSKSFKEEDLSYIIARFSPGKYMGEKTIYYSFGILQEKGIKVWQLKNYQLVYLGLNYKENIESKEDLKLELFGKILSDPSRIKILEYIRVHGSATVSEINHIFGYSGTTSYYHLSMMQKVGFVAIENRGKTIYYHLNRPFFQKVCAYLSYYN